MASAFGVLRQQAVRRYLGSTAFAAVGINICITALFKQVYDITGDPFSIGLLGLAQFIPGLVLALPSGYIADRFDRRRVTSGFLLLRLLSVAVLVWFSTSGSTSVSVLVLVAVGIGVADALISPSRRAILPLITTSEDLPRVIALWTATFTSSAIVGPALAGLLYSIDPSIAYVVAGVSALLAIPLTLGIQYRPGVARIADEQRPSLRLALQGLSFIRRSPIVLAAISLDLFAVLFGGAVALIPVVASDRLGVGDVAYGWLRAAPGVGAAAMAIVLAIRPVTRRVGPMLLVVVAIFGAGTVVFGLTRSYAVAFLALVVLSAADMVSMFIRGAIVPLATPPEQLGRVTAVEGVFIGASNELGAFESGLAARWLGVPWAIAGGGMATIVIAAAFAIGFPTLRKIDRFDDVASAASA
ncbi:MAG: MFS transporter [Ilumatobacteraceae bacterium]